MYADTMNKYDEEIVDDLIAIIDKIEKFENKEGKLLFREEVFLHISYTIEYVSGLIGTTDKLRAVVENEALAKKKSN